MIRIFTAFSELQHFSRHYHFEKETRTQKAMKFRELLLIFVICGVFGQLETKKEEICGIKPEFEIGVRVYGGETVDNKAEWPWLVAFVNIATESFFCSGSLISTKHVLSGEFKSVRILKLLKCCASVL